MKLLSFVVVALLVMVVSCHDMRMETAGFSNDAERQFKDCREEFYKEEHGENWMGNDVFTYYVQTFPFKGTADEANNFCMAQNMKMFFSEDRLKRFEDITKNQDCRPSQVSEKMWKGSVRTHLHALWKNTIGPDPNPEHLFKQQRAGHWVPEFKYKTLGMLCMVAKLNGVRFDAELLGNFRRLLFRAKHTQPNKQEVRCKVFKPEKTEKLLDICPRQSKKQQEVKPKVGGGGGSGSRRRRLLQFTCPKAKLLDLTDRKNTAGFQFPPIAPSMYSMELYLPNGKNKDIKIKTELTGNGNVEFICTTNLCCNAEKLLAKVKLTKLGPEKVLEVNIKRGEKWAVDLTPLGGRRRLLTMGSRSRGGSCRL